VKSTFRGGRSGDNGFSLRLCCRGGQGPYSIDEVDFIAAFIAKHDAWYLIPVESVSKKTGINLYPRKRRIKPGCGLFEQYRESWHLLLDEQTQKPVSYPS